MAAASKWANSACSPVPVLLLWLLLLLLLVAVGCFLLAVGCSLLAVAVTPSMSNAASLLRMLLSTSGMAVTGGHPPGSQGSEG